MALVNGGFMHYTDIKKFSKNLLRNSWSDFEIISQEYSLGDLLKKCWRNFDPFIHMALVNGGFMCYTNMKKFLKNHLLRNRLSDFEIISQECPVSDLSKKLLAKFSSVFKHGSNEWGLLLPYRRKEILKKSSSLKPLVIY